MRPVLLGAALLVFPGCGDGTLGPVLSPAPGSTITAPVIPLILRTPDRKPARELSVQLDGEDVTDPNMVRRFTPEWIDEGHHIIGTLDLTDVAPGEHELTLSYGAWPGALHHSSRFTLAPPEVTLEVRVEDETGAPVPGRVYVFDEALELVELTSAGTAVDHHGRDVDQHAIFCPDGTGMTWLAPGTYTLVGWRGLREDLDIRTVTLEAGTQELAFTVPTAVETPGEVTSDLHVHTGASMDAWIPDRLRFESLNSVGLDVYVITEHDHVTDAPARSAASLPDASARAVSGIEVDMRVKRPNRDVYFAAGHLNIFPVEAGADHPANYQDTPAEIVGEAFAMGQTAGLSEANDRVVVQLNHPRGIHFHADEDPESVWQLFDSMGLDRELPPEDPENAWLFTPIHGTAAVDFSVLEVVNRFSLPLYRQVRRDWFYLLDHGYYRTATGNSDTHGLTTELAGMTLTLVEAERRADGQVDLGTWIDSLEAGRARVTTGPLVSLSINGAGPGELIETRGEVEATIRVQAASWVPVDEVRLMVGSSQVFHTTLTAADRTADGRLDKTFTVPFTPTADTWAVAEAGYPLDVRPDDETLGWYARIAPGYTPIGFTNAVKIDVDDGQWMGR